MTRFPLVRVYGINQSVWVCLWSPIHNLFQISLEWIRHVHIAAMQNCILIAQFAAENLVLHCYSLGQSVFGEIFLLFVTEVFMHQD